MKAILFDVDGTLMKAGGAGREALARATAQVLDAPLDRVRAAAHEVDFRGRTDEILIEDLCRRVGFATTGLDSQLVAAYLEALTEMLPQAPTEIMPGVPEPRRSGGAKKKAAPAADATAEAKPASDSTEEKAAE